MADPHWTDRRFGPRHKWLRWVVEQDGYIVSNWGDALKVKID